MWLQIVPDRVPLGTAAFATALRTAAGHGSPAPGVAHYRVTRGPTTAIGLLAQHFVIEHIAGW